MKPFHSSNHDFIPKKRLLSAQRAVIYISIESDPFGLGAVAELRKSCPTPACRKHPYPSGVALSWKSASNTGGLSLANLPNHLS